MKIFQARNRMIRKPICRFVLIMKDHFCPTPKIHIGRSFLIRRLSLTAVPTHQSDMAYRKLYSTTITFIILHPSIPRKDSPSDTSVNDRNRLSETVLCTYRTKTLAFQTFNFANKLSYLYYNIRTKSLGRVIF